MATKPPVVFLAFANERIGDDRFLRNLTAEASHLQQSLTQAEHRGLCELVVRQNASTRDILDVFQDREYRDRIAVFHYGGHASDYQLLFESASGEPDLADAASFAEFLGHHDGLRLVFLNGCSTAAQANGLLTEGVPAVVATSEAIDDAAATGFAGRFYNALSGRSSLGDSFEEASAALRTEHGGEPRNVIADDAVDQLPWNEWPWELYVDEGSDAAGWALSRPVNRFVLAALVAAALAIVTAAAAYASIPSDMEGLFNIAIADFGELDAEGNVHSSEDGARLSRYVYETMLQEIEQLPADFPVELWHDSMGFREKRVSIGTMSGSNPIAREAAATQLADEIDANIVVYGNLEHIDERKAHFVPEFVVAELRGEADDIKGRHRLGSHVEAALPVESTASLAKLNRELSLKAVALTRFATALTYELGGDSVRALELLQATDEELPSWRDGRELLYLFIGREHALIAQRAAESGNLPTDALPGEDLAMSVGRHREQAVAAYRSALVEDPNLARAFMGLAGVYYVIAQDQPAVVRCEAHDIELATNNYYRALSPIHLPESTIVESKARSGLGNALRLMAASTCECESPTEAQPIYEQALEQLESAAEIAQDATPQQRAHAFLSIGATHEARYLCQQLVGAESLADLEAAIEAYESCMNAADQDLGDWHLQELSGTYCEQYAARLNAELELNAEYEDGDQ